MSPPTSSPSLLANRQQAVRQWEVTQVNELLEQLSDYPGVVVLATNRLAALDEAVMRRMDAKIQAIAGFDPGGLCLCEPTAGLCTFDDRARG